MPKTRIETERRYYPPEELKKILTAAGFGSVEFSYGYDYHGFCNMIDEKNLENNYTVRAKNNPALDGS